MTEDLLRVLIAEIHADGDPPPVGELAGVDQADAFLADMARRLDIDLDDPTILRGLVLGSLAPGLLVEATTGLEPYPDGDDNVPVGPLVDAITLLAYVAMDRFVEAGHG